MNILEQRGISRLDNAQVRVGFFCVELYQKEDAATLHGYLWEE